MVLSAITIKLGIGGVLLLPFWIAAIGWLSSRILGIHLGRWRAGLAAFLGWCIGITAAALVVGEQSIVGNLVGSWIDLWELVQLQAAGRVRLVTETHPLESVNEVLDKLRDGDVTGRAVLVP